MRLCQVIALREGVKKTASQVITKAYQAFQKPGLFNGLSRTYAKNDELGEDFPSEYTKVQRDVNAQLEQTRAAIVELWDVTATNDIGNTIAKATIEIEGKALAQDLPPTYLLFLEKQLQDWLTHLEAIPVLDPSQDWVFDQNADTWKAKPTRTARTKKITKPLKLAPATEQHAEQVTTITEDVVIGYWTLENLSGALPESEKRSLLRRAQKLLAAVKVAREAANTTEVEKVKVGDKLMTYLLTGSVE